MRKVTTPTRTSRSRSPLPRVVGKAYSTPRVRAPARHAKPLGWLPRSPPPQARTAPANDTFKATRHLAPARSAPKKHARATHRPTTPNLQPTNCKRPGRGPPDAQSRAKKAQPEAVRPVEWCLQALKQACSQEYPESAICVQSLDDSLDSAIRITYRISLRSSSLREPRHPPLKVFLE